MRDIAIESLVRIFLYMTVINLAAAVAFTIPVLVPEFTFPLLLTIWPGTWMFISYFTFLIVAVLGTLAWAVLWDMMKKHFDRNYANSYLAMTNIVLTMVGVYGQTSFTFVLGYWGGYATLVGIGRGIVTQGIIGWMVVPIGLFIFFHLVGTIAGIANLVTSKSGAILVDQQPR